MSDYRIMDRKLSAYSYQGHDGYRAYTYDYLAHIDPNDMRYGDVLVEMKRVKCGFGINIRFFYRSQMYWKPEYRFNFKWGDVYFHWLFFMIWYKEEYRDVIDKVVKDHLAEHLAANK